MRARLLGSLVVVLGLGWNTPPGLVNAAPGAAGLRGPERARGLAQPRWPIIADEDEDGWDDGDETMLALRPTSPAPGRAPS